MCTILFDEDILTVKFELTLFETLSFLKGIGTPVLEVRSDFPGFGERVDTFFPSRMWHHAGRPTTGHCTETIGINVTSPQETDNCTLILDKQKFKASISSKNELDYPSY